MLALFAAALAAETTPAPEIAPDVTVDTLWRVTASTVDPSLVGRVFRTKGLPQAGQVTAHRFPVESVT